VIKSENVYPGIDRKGPMTRAWRIEYEEEQRIWEDLRHGIILGTKKIVQKIKKRYLPDMPNSEIPHQKQPSKSKTAQNKFNRFKSLIKI